MELFNTRKVDWMSQNEENCSIENLGKELSIAVGVRFGMPSKDCAYSGICRIEPESNREVIKGKCFGLAHIFWRQNNHLFFRFPKGQMSQRTIEKYFGSGHFVIIEPYQSPEFICKAFGKNTLIICPGVYPIKDKDQSYEVNLKIRWE